MDFTLRPWKKDDLESLVYYANNLNIAKNLSGRFPYPYTREAGGAFIQFATTDLPIHIFAIDIEGKAVGGIGIHPQTDIHCKNAELGYWIGEPFWNKGIITKAIPQIVDFGFRTFEIDRIFARCFSDNIASQRVLEKTGFSLEAHFKDTLFKYDRTTDELIYGIRRK